MISSTRRRLAPAGLLALAVVLGCTQEPDRPQDSLPREPVSGVVSYRGQPVPGGYLHFYSLMGHVGTFPILTNGTGKYFAQLPQGTVRVCVSGDRSAQQVPGVMPDGKLVVPKHGPNQNGGPGGPGVKGGPEMKGGPGMNRRPGKGDPGAPARPEPGGLPKGLPADFKRPRQALGGALSAEQRRGLEEISAKYGFPHSRSLKTFAVKPGGQTFDIVLD